MGGRGRVPGPVSVGDDGGGGSRSARGPIGLDSHLTFAEFRDAVLDAQIARKRSQGKPFFEQVPAADLEEVEEGYRMRKAAARSCRDLLAAARQALGSAQQAGDAGARDTASIGVCSGYRDFAYDRKKWNETFQKHYDLMLAAHRFRGDEHGRRAQGHMLKTMLPLKAPPGFSNHSNGTAVDFKTVFGGTLYAADSLQIERWPKTWLYGWLVPNAHNFGFRPLASEPWHWDHD